MKTVSILSAKDPIEKVIKLLIPVQEKLELHELLITSEELTLVLASLQSLASCPVCGQETRRLHSTYMRPLQDLPWGLLRLQLHVQVHRFFCQNPNCKRKIFTERLPELAEPFARRTNRLRDALLTIAWA
jgi:transposase